MDEIYYIPIPGAHKSREWANNQANPTTYPGTVGINRTPISGATTFELPPDWADYIYEINVRWGSVKGFLLAIKNWSGWVNTAANGDYPGGFVFPHPMTIAYKVEGVTSVHNYVKQKEGVAEKNNSIPIETLDWTKPPPDIEKVNPDTHPWYFQVFHAVNGDLAPEGELFIHPLLVKGGMGWIEKTSKVGEPQMVKVDDYTPLWGVEEDMNLDQFSHGVDIHPTYQHPYQGSHDPNWPVHFVIQKASQRLSKYSNPSNGYYSKWKAQKESIPSSMPIGNYHYYQTDANGGDQADIMLDIMNDEGYDFCAMDFESGGNEITDGEIREYVDAMIYAEAQTDKKVLHYTNDWINDFIGYLCLRIWKGKYQAWFEGQILWLAGGPLYGEYADTMPSENYDPFKSDNYNYGWTNLQFYADRDELGERTGFKDGDVDYNRLRVPYAEIHEYFNTGRGDTPAPPDPDPIGDCGDVYLRGWNDCKEENFGKWKQEGYSDALDDLQIFIDEHRG